MLNVWKLKKLKRNEMRSEKRRNEEIREAIEAERSLKRREIYWNEETGLAYMTWPGYLRALCVCVVCDDDVLMMMMMMLIWRVMTDANHVHFLCSSMYISLPSLSAHILYDWL
jgi:hypothetical protein